MQSCTGRKGIPLTRYWHFSWHFFSSAKEDFPGNDNSSQTLCPLQNRTLLLLHPEFSDEDTTINVDKLLTAPWNCHKLHAWNKQRMINCLRWQLIYQCLQMPMSGQKNTSPTSPPFSMPQHAASPALHWCWEPGEETCFCQCHLGKQQSWWGWAWGMHSLMGSGIEFADMTILVVGSYLPQLCNSLTELNKFWDPADSPSKNS